MVTSRTAVSASTLQAIRDVATDYHDSWLEGDADRMRASLHPDLAKRRAKDADGGLELHEVPADDLIQSVGEEPQHGIPHDQQVTILDATDEIASVMIRSTPFVEYLHLARFGQRWLIVNALYERRERS